MRTAAPTRRAGDRARSAWARPVIKRVAVRYREGHPRDRRARGTGSRKRAGDRRAAVRDEPAMPAASPRRQVDQVEVTLAVGSPRNWSTTKIKLLRVLEIPIWITAGIQSERVDFFGNARAWVGEAGCLGACQGGLFRRRLDRARG